MFDLKRPCNNCPFRKGVGEAFMLPRKRLEEIRDGDGFQCHKTIDYGSFDNAGRSGDRPQQCAGWMALHAETLAPAIMQLAARMRVLDVTELDPDGVAYPDWPAAFVAHGHEVDVVKEDG